MKINGPRLFFIFSLTIFLIASIAYVWVELSISTQSTKDAISDESTHPDAETGSQITGVNLQRTNTVYRGGTSVGAEAMEDNGRPEAVQSQPDYLPAVDFENITESKYGVSEAQINPSAPSERKQRIIEIKKRTKWLLEEMKRLAEEEATLPPRPSAVDRRARSPIIISHEEMERENEIAERRLELRLKSVEHSKEFLSLQSELKAMQHEQ